MMQTVIPACVPGMVAVMGTSGLVVMDMTDVSDIVRRTRAQRRSLLHRVRRLPARGIAAPERL